MEDNREMMNEEIKTEVVENEETTEKESVVNDESNNEEKWKLLKEVKAQKRMSLI